MQDKTLLNFFLKKNKKIRYFTTFATHSTDIYRGIHSKSRYSNAYTYILDATYVFYVFNF
jgi:hypothetical protein